MSKDATCHDCAHWEQVNKEKGEGECVVNGPQVIAALTMVGVERREWDRMNILKQKYEPLTVWPITHYSRKACGKFESKVKPTPAWMEPWLYMRKEQGR